MSRKKEKIMYTLLCIAVFVIISLSYQNVKSNREHSKMISQYEEEITRLKEGFNPTLSQYSEEIIQLKYELKEKEKIIEQKEMEMESLQIDYAKFDAYIVEKFHPDGRIYNIDAANIAFYPDPELTGRLSELSEFISDVSDPLERKDGTTIYSYLTTKGVVYSDMRVSLYARQN